MFRFLFVVHGVSCVCLLADCWIWLWFVVCDSVLNVGCWLLFAVCCVSFDDCVLLVVC